MAVIIFNWSTHGLSFVQRNLKKWILSGKSSCIRRKTTETFIYGLWWATEDILEDAMHVVYKAARRYGDLATLNWSRYRTKVLSIFCSLGSRLVFICLYCFLLVWRSWRLSLGFSYNLPHLLASTAWSGLVGSWAALLTLFVDPYEMVPNCFYSAVSVRLAGNNSLIHFGRSFLHYMLYALYALYVAD